ncbi:MAG: MBL fold metallo-hydrolase [Hyphomicrobiaceae bacterium]
MTEINFRTEMEFAYGVPRELAPGVVRLVANNPSVFTYKGTNTYIIGANDDIALIDPGPQDDAHFDAIMQTIGSRRVSHILITHTHLDHIAGLDRLASATGAEVCGHGRSEPRQRAATASPSGGEFFDATFAPDRQLRDGDAVSGSDWSLKALFTPGHAPDHLSFELSGQEILFSGDHVMGWNTSVIAPPEGNMADYLGSLERLLDRNDQVYFPGHGGQIADPQRFARAFLVHRRVREQAILAAITEGHNTISKVVAKVYAGLDERLVTAASLSVQAHVEHLAERDMVRTGEELSFTSQIIAV